MTQTSRRAKEPKASGSHKPENEEKEILTMMYLNTVKDAANAPLPQANANGDTASDTVTLDTAPAAKTSAGVVSATLDNLRAESHNWQATAFKTANELLWNILSQCLALDEELGGNGKEVKAKREELTSYCDANGYRFKTSTERVVKIVKCVFGVDANRSRVSAYSLALRSAKEHKIGSAGLVEWLREKGGVEEVRLKGSPNYKTDKQRAAEVREEVLGGKALATFSNEVLAEKFNRDIDEDAVLLVATHNADGSFSIHRLIQSTTAVNNALNCCYAEVKKEATGSRAVEEAATKQVQTLDAIAIVSEHNAIAA